MKFQHIPIGTRFRYEGRIYAKTGPLTAVGDEGGQRIIPRYAVLAPVGEDGGGPADGRLDPALVSAAFEAFYASCLQEVDEAGRGRLEALRRRFFERLELRPEQPPNNEEYR